MGWADKYIIALRKGETVSFRPKGLSMTGRIESGDLCTVKPIDKDEQLFYDDIVLCRVGGYQYLHLISNVDQERKMYQISNNHGRENGWISKENIFGRLIKVEK